MQKAIDTARMGVGDAEVIAPGAGHPECGSHPGNGHLIKIATTHGGCRAGAGRKPASVRVTPGVDGPRWYCVEVHRRQEVAVVEALTALGFEAVAPQFLDLVPANAARRLAVREVLRPAFPGYVLVEFDQSSPLWRRIASVRGVRAVMGSGPERPSPLAAVHVAWVLGQFGFGGAQRRSRLAAGEAAAPLVVGLVVRVIAGPFDGVTGVVVASNGRAVVLSVGGHRVRMAQAAVCV